MFSRILISYFFLDAHVNCKVAKCELYGPGGSHKDRVAKRLVEDAEKNGILKSGCTIIYPSSGNAGIQ